MTIADRKSSLPRKSWLDRLRRVPSVPKKPGLLVRNGVGSSRLQKPLGDMADLIVMSTVDLKAPPQSAGTGDLLDALVQEHLERATEVAPETVSPAELSMDAQAAMLQREIETLLQDEVPAETAVLASDATVLEAAKPAPEAAKSTVTPAELDVLLAENAPVVSAPEMAGAAGTAESETDYKLTEAEGVLAEELAKLMAEADGTVAEPKAGESAVAPVAVEAVANGEAMEKGVEPAAAGILPAAATIAESHREMAEIQKDAKGATEEVVEERAPREGIWRRVRQIGNDVMLMVAQIIDLPFGWIDEINKNIIGVAALLLGLGGMVMWILSRYTN